MGSGIDAIETNEGAVMTTHTLGIESPVVRRFPGVADLNRSCVSLTVWVTECLNRAGQRRALRDLDERLLRDIGVSRTQAIHEATKPFWKN